MAATSQKTAGQSAGQLDAFFGPNAGYVLDLYDRYRDDPTTVDPQTGAWFDTIDPAELERLTSPPPPPTNGLAPVASRTAPTVSGGAEIAKVVGAVALARSIRHLGHLAANVDPLGSEPPGAPELNPNMHGIDEQSLQALPGTIVNGPIGQTSRNAMEAIQRLRDTYTNTIGYDFDHVKVAAERAWLRDVVGDGRFCRTLSDKASRVLLKRLTEVEGFEQFLHQTYLGQKRFSIEGNDILIPMLDEIIHEAAADGAQEIVIGMAHRGRLNVLTHILGKPYAAILAAFEGARSRPVAAPTDSTDTSTGDVKYHLGAKLARSHATGETVEVPLVLAPNPSHLEFVNPVVEGMTRASQDAQGRKHPGAPAQNLRASLAIVLHGDASFPGQGIVAETLNLSGLNGYTTGGTIHIIVNNQVGFTTDWEDSRSTVYASDLAKGFEIPIIHVNADDPEACLTAATLALAYRDTFGKDFLIDLIGYRRWGHNEGDEPAFTQPRLYEKIAKHPTVRTIWAQRCIERGLVTVEEVKAMQQAVLDRLAGIRREVTEGDAPVEEEETGPGIRREVQTAVSLEQLRAYHDALHAFPADFKPNPKLARQWDRRRGLLDQNNPKIDWAHAEGLAFAAILADGTPIRLTGQDTERGTFSQRHLILHDAQTGDEFCPLQHLPQAQASFAVYNSPLSEAAAVGFEYGYSVHAPDALVLWEAQYGDFANGAQVLIDQFIVAARAKWRQHPSLVLLLPHGYEGSGPEHSSARLERFLQLAAGDNIRVCNCTTAAQYFHLLRRQAARLAEDPRPLVLMSPKSLLRNAFSASPVAELISGTFLPVIDDADARERRESVTRLVLCTGKVAVDLLTSAERQEAEGVAIARVEQVAPFQNTALRGVIDNYPNLAEIVWVQEEPRNMGAWSFVQPRLRELVELPVRYIGRREQASPAEGSADLHLLEQQRIVSEALTDATVAKRSRRSAGPAKTAANGQTSRKTAKSRT